MRLVRLLFVCALAPAVMAQSADLSVTVTMPATAVYDALAQFSVATATGQFTLTNAGPSIAQNVTIDFDAYLSNVFVPGFGCGTTNGHYRCTAATMAPGSLTASFSETWGLPRDGTSRGTVETTTVTVSSSSPGDPNPANNSASTNTAVVWQSDPELSSVDTPAFTAPGNSIVVTANYLNNGPSPASDFKLTLTVPPGTSYSTYSADKWLTCTEPPKGGQGDLICTAPALGVLRGSISALVRVDPTTPSGTVITFPATIESTSAIQSPKTLSGSLTVTDPAALHVEISAPASAHPGDTFLTTITVTNQGPGTAFNPEVLFTQPNFSYGPMTGPAGWNCVASCSSNSFAPGTATFTFPTTLPWNASPGSLPEQAVARASNNVPDFASIANGSIAIIAWPPSSLKLTMTAAPAAVHTSDDLTYTATIENTGNADAKNVQLYWTLPGTAAATTCGTVNDSVCTFPTIGAGATQTATRTLQVAAGAGTVLTAQTMVKAANVAYDAPSASATVATTVAGVSHVNLAAQIAPPSAPRAGMTWPWVYRVYNAGPDTATDWQLSFPIPPNTTVVDGSFPGSVGTCTGLTPNASNIQVTCHGTYLPALAEFNVLVDLAIAPETTAPIHATATVSTANVDAFAPDNTATADTPVTAAQPASDLSIAVEAAPTTLNVGNVVTYVVVATNIGAASASNVTVQLNLPPSLTVLSASPQSPIATLGSGASATFTVTARATEAGTITARASVATTSEELNTANNSAAATIVVNAVTAPARRRAARH
ncbi:MAG TPA: CARDB domain-containing protein [Thermoanaerobaculia bacterium]|jgi:uncharacterized repeat protein (TIGR01451 family)